MSEHTALETQLYQALQLALEHLDWIGWGDSYERSCAGGVREATDMAVLAYKKES